MAQITVHPEHLQKDCYSQEVNQIEDSKHQGKKFNQLNHVNDQVLKIK